MPFFPLIRRCEPFTEHAEPRAFPVGHVFTRTSTGMPQADSDPLAMLGEHQADGDRQGSEAIFGLIGSRPALDGGAMSRTSAQVDTDDLMAGLHMQYCQALDNPFGAAYVTDWESATEESGRYVRSEFDASVDSHLRDAGQDSIEALLSGAQQLDHAFGPLRQSDLGSLPEAEPVPEILRLFAPPEYLAAAFRSMPPLPPTLARREHHSPGIDSPLCMPEVKPTGDSR